LSPVKTSTLPYLVVLYLSAVMSDEAILSILSYSKVCRFSDGKVCDSEVLSIAIRAYNLLRLRACGRTKW